LFVTAMYIYVFLRISSVPWIKKRLSVKARSALFLALWAVFLLGRMYGHGRTGLLATTLEFIAMNLTGALLLISASLVLVDVITVFGLLMKKSAPKLRASAVVVGLTLSVIALFQGMRPPVVERHDVYLSGLPDEMNEKVIVGISDLHLGSLIGAGFLKGVVSRVQSLRPDMIVLLGDIFDGHEPPQDELLPLFHELKAPLGVWAVPGNHDLHGGDDSFIRFINDNGISMLENAWAEPFPGFYLAGIGNPRGHHHLSDGGKSIRESLKGRPEGGATVLMSHNADNPDVAARGGVGLMLSGHTHGGQMWPFTYLVKRRYPLLEGMHEVNGMTVIVCRGTGTWGPRMRLWSPGEILHITLHHKPEG
jgi:predicted MPP superfamily phosphohydrolase